MKYPRHMVEDVLKKYVGKYLHIKKAEDQPLAPKTGVKQGMSQHETVARPSMKTPDRTPSYKFVQGESVKPVTEAKAPEHNFFQDVDAHMQNKEHRHSYGEESHPVAPGISIDYQGVHKTRSGKMVKMGTRNEPRLSQYGDPTSRTDPHAIARRQQLASKTTEQYTNKLQLPHLSEDHSHNKQLATLSQQYWDHQHRDFTVADHLEAVDHYVHEGMKHHAKAHKGWLESYTPSGRLNSSTVRSAEKYGETVAPFVPTPGRKVHSTMRHPDDMSQYQELKDEDGTVIGKRSKTQKEEAWGIHKFSLGRDHAEYAHNCLRHAGLHTQAIANIHKKQDSAILRHTDEKMSSGMIHPHIAQASDMVRALHTLLDTRKVDELSAWEKGPKAKDMRMHAVHKKDAEVRYADWRSSHSRALENFTHRLGLKPVSKDIDDLSQPEPTKSKDTESQSTKTDYHPGKLRFAGKPDSAKDKNIYQAHSALFNTGLNWSKNTPPHTAEKEKLITYVEKRADETAAKHPTKPGKDIHGNQAKTRLVPALDPANPISAARHSQRHKELYEDVFGEQSISRRASGPMTARSLDEHSQEHDADKLSDAEAAADLSSGGGYVAAKEDDEPHPTLKHFRHPTEQLAGPEMGGEKKTDVPHQPMKYRAPSMHEHKDEDFEKLLDYAHVEDYSEPHSVGAAYQHIGRLTEKSIKDMTKDALKKALTTGSGYTVAPEQRSGGSVLMRESLGKTVAVTGDFCTNCHTFTPFVGDKCMRCTMHKSFGTIENYRSLAKSLIKASVEYLVLCKADGPSNAMKFMMMPKNTVKETGGKSTRMTTAVPVGHTSTKKPIYIQMPSGDHKGGMDMPAHEFDKYHTGFTPSDHVDAVKFHMKSAAKHHDSKSEVGTGMRDWHMQHGFMHLSNAMGAAQQSRTYYDYMKNFNFFYNNKKKD